jgi:hypothetical protein
LPAVVKIMPFRHFEQNLEAVFKFLEASDKKQQIYEHFAFDLSLSDLAN